MLFDLLFVLTCFLNNDWFYQSNAAFILQWVICVWGDLFVHTHFLGKNFKFWIFYLFLIWRTFMPKMWMSGVGTLCANAHYRASLSQSTYKIFAVFEEGKTIYPISKKVKWLDVTGFFFNKKPILPPVMHLAMKAKVHMKFDNGAPRHFLFSMITYCISLSDSEDKIGGDGDLNQNLLLKSATHSLIFLRLLIWSSKRPCSFWLSWVLNLASGVR